MLRRSQLGEVASLLIPAHLGPYASWPRCIRCGGRPVDRQELVERGPLFARVLITCRNHGGPHGEEQLHTVEFESASWDWQDLQRALRGIRWFDHDVAG